RCFSISLSGSPSGEEATLRWRGARHRCGPRCCRSRARVRRTTRMRATALSSVAVTALALAGCLFGPDYERPNSDIPKAFRFELGDARDVANAEWWRQFGDPKLNELINTALSNNWNLQIAAAQIEHAGGVLMSTRSGFYPQLNYNVSAQRDRFSQ